jgi:hypothetical protein
MVSMLARGATVSVCYRWATTDRGGRREHARERRIWRSGEALPSMETGGGIVGLGKGRGHRGERGVVG